MSEVTRSPMMGGGANYRKAFKNRGDVLDTNEDPSSDPKSPTTPTKTPAYIIDSSKDPADILADLIFELLKTGLTPEQKLSVLNAFVKFAKSLDTPMDSFCPVDDLVLCLRTQLTNTVKEVRAASLRALRYLATTVEIVQAIIEAHIDVFIVISLEQPTSNELERTQALKLVRCLCEVAPMEVPRSLVSCLVEISDVPEDKFSKVCLESVCELALRNPHIVAVSGGVKSLTKTALSAHSRRMIEAIVLSLMYIIGDDATRRFVRVDLDIDVLLGPFTDEFFTHSVVDKPTTHDTEQRLFASRVAIVTMLRTWPGIIYLSSSPHRLKAVIEVLRLAKREYRIAAMDLLFEALHLDTPELSDKFDTVLASRTPGGKTNSISMFDESGVLPRAGGRINLLPKYKAVLLLCLVRAGLVESLSEVIKGDDKIQTVRATVLLGEMLHMSNQFLPSSYTASLQLVPSLVRHAASFLLDPTDRTQAQSALSNLDRLHYTKHMELSLYSVNLHMAVTHAKKYAPIDSLPSLERSRQRMKQMRAAISLELDDVSFQNLIRDSFVLTAKEFSKWDWDVISQLISGPFQNPKRLEESIHNKFIRKLLTFYKPSEKQFCDVSINDNAAAKYTRVGLELLELLMFSEEGTKELRDSNLITQISDGLVELDPNGQPPVTPSPPNSKADNIEHMYTPDKIAYTQTRDYFVFIGKLSTTAQGSKILDKANTFGRLYACLDKFEREDVIKLIITSLDYNLESHCRVILTKVLTTSTKPLRLFTTEHMRVLFRASVQAFSQWGTDLLVGQLYDLDLEICYKALEVLDECCSDESMLNSLVMRRPALLHLGEPGKALLIRFLSTFRGLKYLNDANFTQRELTLWFNYSALDYVSHVESILASTTSWYGDHETSGITGTHSYSAYVNSHVASLRRVFRDISQSYPEQVTLNWMRLGHVPLPVHLFGELAKTKDGCNMLRATGKFQNFVEVVKMMIDRESPTSSLSASTSTSANTSSSSSSFSSSSSSLPSSTSNGSLSTSSNLLDLPSISVTRKLSLASLNDLTSFSSADSATAVLETKAALWSIGQVASASTYGCAFIIELGAIPLIVDLMKITTSMALRGTCYYALALCAQTPEGCKVLEDLQWECATDSRANPIGICIPKDHSILFNFPSVPFEGSWALLSPFEYNPLKDGKDPNKDKNGKQKTKKELDSDELIKQIGNLCNDVLGNSSRRTIRKLKEQYPDLFQSVEIYTKAFIMVSNYYFHLSARRFLQEMFDVTFDAAALQTLDSVLSDANATQTTVSILAAAEKAKKQEQAKLAGKSTVKAPSAATLLSRAMKF